MLLSEIEGRITMESKNYSAEAMVLENGKYVKGTLTLFIDEYVFAGKRTSVNWENATVEQGTVKVKSFLFSLAISATSSFKNKHLNASMQ